MHLGFSNEITDGSKQCISEGSAPAMHKRHGKVLSFGIDMLDISNMSYKPRDKNLIIFVAEGELLLFCSR